MTENTRIILLELLLGGFFAVACLRASASSLSASNANFRNFLRFPGRIERLRRSRWQWTSMVALMLVLRLQNQLPMVLEGMALVQFLLFMALPSRDTHRGKVRKVANEAAVASR